VERSSAPAAQHTPLCLYELRGCTSEKAKVGVPELGLCAPAKNETVLLHANSRAHAQWLGCLLKPVTALTKASAVTSRSTG
jgi:hypothetical protein